jgi:D-arabinose 1-dehydrogenase-like Zn-dependent alcohol dehydrogenase
MKLLPDFNNCYLYTKIMKSIQITEYGGNDVVEVKKTVSVLNISSGKVLAYVATTVSTNDKQFVQELGADQIIDYKKENFEDILQDYDAVFDTVGGETYKRSFRVLEKGSGIIVSTLEQPNSELMGQYRIKALFLFSQVNR